MRSLALMIPLFLAPPLWADCLQVSERALQPAEMELGASTVAWSALLENRCERPFDAELKVQFTDEEGTVLYEVRDYVIVERLATIEIGNSVYVPSTYIEGIRYLEIVLEERERPM